MKTKHWCYTIVILCIAGVCFIASMIVFPAFWCKKYFGIWLPWKALVWHIKVLKPESHVELTFSIYLREFPAEEVSFLVDRVCKNFGVERYLAITLLGQDRVIDSQHAALLLKSIPSCTLKEKVYVYGLLLQIPNEDIENRMAELLQKVDPAYLVEDGTPLWKKPEF